MKAMKRKFAISTVGLFLPALSFAAQTFTLDLSSRAYFDEAGSNGLWDSYHQKIGAAVAPNADSSKRIDFGDGSDGVFLDGPAQTGITVSGSAITIDTNQKSSFRFTTFTLSAGTALNVTGSEPLVIRVLGPVTIAGQIRADGATGSTNTGTGPTRGGAGVAGGGDGGQGGGYDPLQAGTAGSPSTSSVAGGGIGTNATSTSDDCGGGGGCNGIGPDAGNDATPGMKGFIAFNNAGGCVVGQTRSAIGSAFETAFTAGAGGGGGGAYRDPITPAFRYAGGGGGAGGGAIRFVALGAISISGGGTLSAQGGSGGATVVGDGADCGGGGGGGSGGSIWLQSLESISGGGTVNISGGIGGSTALCSSGYDGGNGSRGIYRSDSPSGSQSIASITPAGSTQALSILSPAGETYTVLSKPISFAAGYFAFDTPTESYGCGSDGNVSVSYEGSYDGVQFSGAVPGSRIQELNEYSYLRFRVSISTSGSSPPCLTGLAIPYRLRELENLTLSGGLACGSTQGPGTKSDIFFLGILFLISWSAKRFSGPKRA